MIHLYYSNHLEALLAPLSTALSRRDPFHQPTISVPNPHLKQWLNLRLAARQGIAVNLRYLGLEALLAELLGGDRVKLLPSWTLQMRIVEGLVACLDSGSQASEPLRHFFGDEPTHAKLFQLAARLAQLYREYGFSRMDMLSTWEEGRSYFDEQIVAESWQRLIWKDVLERLKSFSLGRNDPRENPDPCFLPLSAFPKPSRGVAFGAVHLFGISYISHQFQVRLKQLSAFGDIHIYVLNPCRVYWEDVTSRRASDRQEPISEEDAAGLRENPFLQVWGRPGREYFKLLNELGSWDFHDAFEEPTEESPSLLQQLQAEILDRMSPDHETEKLVCDNSLRILACPSPRREAEVIANQIWDLMIEDPQLTWRDVAVIAVDMPTYQPEIESAFQRIQRIPYNMIDVVSGHGKSLLDAVQQLLDLPGGMNQRDDLFRLFLHPNFSAKFPDADPQTWLDWADRTGIFFGRDKQQQAEAGFDYFADDVFHWEQGFRRLLLGPYIHERHRNHYYSGRQRYEVVPLAEEDAAEFRQFYTMVQSLFFQTDEGMNQRRSGQAWAEAIRGLITDFLEPLPGDGGDFESVLQLIGRLSDLDIGVAEGQALFDYTTVKSFLLDGLAQLRSFVGSYLTGGVTVSSLQPMRPIPFKVIFVMGMNESVFPRPNHRDTLDLRWFNPQTGGGSGEHRRLGDVSDQEKDGYMFLETLVSTRDRLILSYVDRDQRTQEPRFPSSVIHELKLWLARTCSDFREERHPLKSYAATYSFPDWRTQGLINSHDPIAAGVAFALAAAEQQPETASPMDNQSAPDLDYRFSVDRLLMAREAASDIQRISISALRKFLECPLQASARMVLGWEDGAGPALEELGEPMHLGGFSRFRQLEGLMDHFLAKGKTDFDGEAESWLKEWSWFERARGQMPAGMPADAIQHTLRDVLRCWLAGTKAWPLGHYVGRLPLGVASQITEQMELAPLEFTLNLKGEAQRVALVGKSQALFRGEDTWQSALFKASRLEAKGVSLKDRQVNLPEIKPTYLLSGWIEAVVLAASGYRDHRAHIFGAEAGEPGFGVHYRIEQAQAVAYLEGLLTDMLTGPHDYLLPIEWIWRHVQRNGFKPAEADFLDQATRDLAGQPDDIRVSSRYGPVTRWWSYPPADRLQQRFERRYGPWLEQLADESTWLVSPRSVRGKQ